MRRAGQVVVAQQGTAHPILPGSSPQGGVRRRVFQLCQQVQAGVQPRKGQLLRRKEVRSAATSASRRAL